MNETMFVAAMNALSVLAVKDSKTKEETLAYSAILGYTTSVSRLSRLFIEDAIDTHLNVTNDSDKPSR